MSQIEKATLFCDSAENTVTKVINGYGKKMKFNNGGYRAGVVLQRAGQEDVEGIWFNTQCPDQFAGECWSVLKAVELARETGLDSIIVRNDRIASFKATTKKGYKGSTYLWVAEKIAKEHNIEVEFQSCTSEENLADSVSRTEGAAQGIQKPRSQVKAEKEIAASFEKIARETQLAEQTAKAAAIKANGGSDRGPEFAAFFAAHAEQWPVMRDAWKAEGLTSKARDQRLMATVKEWAAANFKP